MDIEPAAASDEIEELSDEFIKTPLKINESSYLKLLLYSKQYIMYNNENINSSYDTETKASNTSFSTNYVQSIASEAQEPSYTKIIKM